MKKIGLIILFVLGVGLIGMNYVKNHAQPTQAISSLNKFTQQVKSEGESKITKVILPTIFDALFKSL